ncbi:hypothetical protein [Acidovorax sp. PRC11]|uniref:hypothetical protein n=1 Tax=Acidovorax sp. PRC11 TaxID=2962592 RepID=UPI002882BE4B|nr:hypothetical protein [Acidovorax sp. PRC11]MDT0137037.1 hypothetical protein [Acidovorax sp. PRC11]
MSDSTSAAPQSAHATADAAAAPASASASSAPAARAKAKAGAKPKAKADRKTRADAKSGSGKPAAAPAATPAKKKAAAAALPAERDAKARKPKLVRDSFTMPKDEYAAIENLKQRLALQGTPAKKSELLRAGLVLLNGLQDAALAKAMQAIPSLKTGRPRAEPAKTEPVAPAKAAKTAKPRADKKN